MRTPSNSPSAIAITPLITASVSDTAARLSPSHRLSQRGVRSGSTGTDLAVVAFVLFGSPEESDPRRCSSWRPSNPGIPDEDDEWRFRLLADDDALVPSDSLNTSRAAVADGSTTADDTSQRGPRHDRVQGCRHLGSA